MGCGSWKFETTKVPESLINVNYDMKLIWFQKHVEFDIDDFLSYRPDLRNA